VASLVSYPLTIGRPATIDVLLVDESTVYRIQLNGRSSRIEPHTPDVPVSALARIVTTRPVVEALGSMKLRVAEATMRGVLEIEAAGE
jgi:hypothetical protein